MRKIIRRLLLGVLVLLLTGMGFAGWEAYRVYRGLNNITGIVQPRTTAEPVVTIPPLNGNQRYNILVLGSDNDKKSEEKRPLTQSMIIVTVDPIHDKVSMLSIPRDFWVPIRGHGYAKIDLAAKYGGIPLARETVERLFHVPIDFYAWVGLDGFRRVVDTFNGVTIDVTHPILDDYYPDDQRPGDPYAFKRVFIPAGWRHLSGRQALEYVRSRHGDAIGDFGRSERQQQVLLALRKKANGLNLITNLPGLVDDLQGFVRTDLNIEQLYQLAQLSRHIDPSTIHRVVLAAPTFCTPGRANSSIGVQDVLYPNWTAIRPMIKSLFGPISPSTNPPAAQNPPPTHPSPAPSSQPHLTHPPVSPTATVTPLPTPTPQSLTAMPGKLVFEREGNVYEMTRSRDVVSLTGDAPIANAIAMPNMSTNGRTVVFTRFSTNYASDLYLLDTTTRRWRQITKDPSTDIAQNVWAAMPVWSPDGRTILFASDRWKLATAKSESRAIDLAIYSVPATGGTPVQLTQPATGAGGDTDPQWRPGTDQFLYVSWAYDASNRVYSRLVLRNPATGEVSYLTTPAGRVLQPAVAPNGRRVAFIRGGSGQSTLVVASLVDSSGGVRLGAQHVVALGRIAQPAFTPDGRWVSYLQADGDGFSLYIVPVKGGPATKIDEVGSDLDAISHPQWIP